MPDSRFSQSLNQQVANEFAASQQYIAIAVHYDNDALQLLATYFYAQALEERNHAMMMVQYLMDTDLPVTIPGIEAPITSFTSLSAPIALALDQEKRVSAQIADLVGLAREEGDFQSEQFLQWFLKEQVEEVASMTTLLRVVERAGDNALLVEDYLARTPREDGVRPDRSGRCRRIAVGAPAPAPAPRRVRPAQWASARTLRRRRGLLRPT